MSGLTNYPIGGDPPVEACFLAPDAVDTAASLSADGKAIVQPNVDPNAEADAVAASATDAISADPISTDPNSAASVNASPDSWRVELAARLERYRTRRKPRTPRYPSLLLPFDAPEGWSRTAPTTSGTAALAASLAGKEFVFEGNTAGIPELTEPAKEQSPQQRSEESSEQTPELRHYRYPEQSPEQSASGRLIAFPRSAAIPVFRPSGLADPVFDHSRPRIVEAPEILPPPPALGGMLIEPAHRDLTDPRAGESPSSSASIARRALAALIDGTILSTAVSAFAAIFLHLNPALNLFVNPGPRRVRESLPLLAGLAVVAIALWAAYQFLFVVYTGSTPGLRSARLRLATFDGSPLSHRSRRWRVLASILSALSVGLGYLWCLLDQDGLCWHDRITRTHVQGGLGSGGAPGVPARPYES
jgi:uncharacterized RDD family membrane protein YckC